MARAEGRRLEGREGAAVLPSKENSRSIRNRATRIEMPDTVLVIESCGIAHRRRISVRRIHTDTEPESRTISPATVIPAITVKVAAATVSPVEVSADVAAWRGVGTVATEVAAA